MFDNHHVFMSVFRMEGELTDHACVYTLLNYIFSETGTLIPFVPDPTIGADSPGAIGTQWQKWLGIVLGSLTGIFQFLVIFFAIVYRWLRDNANGKYPRLQKFSKTGFTICEFVLQGLKAANCCSRRSSGPLEVDYEMGNQRQSLIEVYQTTKCD